MQLIPSFQGAFTPVFSVTWTFRNHSNMLICRSGNISYYYHHQFWKHLCCLTWNQIFWWIENSKYQELSKKIVLTIFILLW